MKVAVLCEYSGVVRDAFIALGHEAISCDLLPTDVPGPHIQGDCTKYDWSGYDLIICHPPCTDLAVSGAAHFAKKLEKDPECQNRALAFVQWMLDLPVKHIAVENPVSIISSRIRKPDQVIQPFMFGIMERKATCLWLKNLPLLIPTKNVYEEMMQLPKKDRERVHYLPPSKDRWKIRSTTYQCFAEAMANQWGNLN